MIAALEGNDTIVGLQGEDRICGGSGSDHIEPGPGDDRVVGGPATDRSGMDEDVVSFRGGPRGIVVDLVSGEAHGQGSDTLAGFEIIEGSRYADRMTASRTGMMTLRGGRGADLLAGSAAWDVLEGGDGADILKGGRGPDAVIGGAGGDRVYGGAGGDFLEGNEGRDLISTGSGAMMAENYGGDGDDHLIGDKSFDYLVGGPGDDVLEGRGGADEMHGEGGADLLIGGGGLDVAMYVNAPGPISATMASGEISGDGDDSIVRTEAVAGSAYGDILRGDESRNILLGFGGDDLIEGGEGFDFAAFYFTDEGVRADLIEGTATGEGSDVLHDIEGLIGSGNGGDTLIGDDAGNVLIGQGGTDNIQGGDGDDVVFPDSKSPRYGSANGDVVDGGPGTRDLITYAFARSATKIDLGAGVTSPRESPDQWTTGSVSDIEWAEGSEWDDLITGDGGVNALFGIGGADDIRGAAGNDQLSGGVGDDSLDGGPDTDNCIGGFTTVECELERAPPGHPLEAAKTFWIKLRFK